MRSDVADGEGGKQGRPGFFATVSAVLGAFIGIRKRSAYERDAAQFKAKHLIVAGVIGGIIFVVSIAMLARFVISQAAQ
ncbi:DUF2970 domain-containing protein [Uliginosibacterium sp. H3]|uniref:DUF2970 domain-containing protein n=1 Tax=Uliginosibacterium silvisoli TaxID=3114758 RepID=A0ABU6K1L0_9RHOO|nr:DUF2970 domain-containing protein [Uliginosibacterium sp. H3]